MIGLEAVVGYVVGVLAGCGLGAIIVKVERVLGRRDARFNRLPPVYQFSGLRHMATIWPKGK